MTVASLLNSTKVRALFSTVGVILVSTALFALAFNAIVAVVFIVRDNYNSLSEPPWPPDDGVFFNSDGSPADNGKRFDLQLRSFDYGAYTNIAEDYASDVLDDFYDLSRLGFVYQPWVQFSEPLFDGKRVHVDLDARGFPIRRTSNPPNDQNLPVAYVFAFGGSTTFGYNVSDEHTWPSYLSAILNEQAEGIHVEVTNYGHGYFKPDQEAVLLMDLLKSGHRPSLALFMDGVNPPRPAGEPAFSDEIAKGFRLLQFPPHWSQHFQWVPMVRMAFYLQRRFSVMNQRQWNRIRRLA